MTSEDFITECQTIFDRNLKPAQLPIYRDKLRRFSSEQLFELLNKVLEEVKSFPKVSEIHKAAQELGFLQTENTFTPHRWKPSDCGYCRGEGRLAVFWSTRIEERPTGTLEIQELTQIFQYTKSFEYKPKPNEFRALFRCKCIAGDALAIPMGWPKLTTSTQLLREVWL